MTYAYKCLNCGKEFTDKNKNRKFCSRSCSALHQGKNGKCYFQKEGIIRKAPWNKREAPIKICQHCNKEFFTSNSSIKYCSKECYALHIKKEKRGKAYKCLYCGKEFYSRCGYKNHTPKFCSNTCKAEYTKANYKKKEYRITCKECGKEIVVGTNRQHQRYCSVSCVNAHKTFYEKGKRVRVRVAARARRAALTIPLDIKFTTALLIAQRGKCAFCGTSLKDNKTIEHLQPISRGGNNQKYNIVWLCKHCNCQKGALTYSEYVDKYERWELIDVLDDILAKAILIEKKINSVKRLKNG